MVKPVQRFPQFILLLQVKSDLFLDDIFLFFFFCGFVRLLCYDVMVNLNWTDGRIPCYFCV